MSSVKLEYIFIEKEKHDSKSVKIIIKEIIKDVADFMDDNSIRSCNDKESEYIKYQIFQKSDSTRCYLKMETVGLRINKAVARMQELDDAFSKSFLQRYYHYIKEYDGISESFCIRLYPKYAKFERKLRQLILLVLTKAYGKSWIDETIAEDMLSKLKENARGNITLNSALENMDLSTLEEYLFEKREPQYKEIISRDLSVEKVKKMSKEELCIVIEKMRATSLWERNFNRYGDSAVWQNKIKSIHNVRNKVAHHKTITEREYKENNKNLNSINKKLNDVIFNIQDHNYTEYEIVDILGSFALMVANKIKRDLDEMETGIIGKIVKHFSEKVQEVSKSLDVDSKKNMRAMLTQIGKLAVSNALRTADIDSVKKVTSIEIAEGKKDISQDNL